MTSHKVYNSSVNIGRPSKRAKRLTLGQRLRNYRLQNDLTFEELSRLIQGISDSTLLRAENDCTLNDRNAYKIEAFLERARAA